MSRIKKMYLYQVGRFRFDYEVLVDDDTAQVPEYTLDLLNVWFAPTGAYPLELMDHEVDDVFNVERVHDLAMSHFNAELVNKV